MRELDRAALRACIDVSEAIEAAAREGLPLDMIARYANVPQAQVLLIVEEMWEDA